MDDMRCAIFGQPERPVFCAGLQASAEMCGDSRIQAMHWLGWLGWLERETQPD